MLGGQRKTGHQNQGGQVWTTKCLKLKTLDFKFSWSENIDIETKLHHWGGPTQNAECVSCVSISNSGYAWRFLSKIPSWFEAFANAVLDVSAGWQPGSEVETWNVSSIGIWIRIPRFHFDPKLLIFLFRSRQVKYYWIITNPYCINMYQLSIIDSHYQPGGD